MSDSGYEYGDNRTPTPWGYWTGAGDAGAYWVEQEAPANAGYTPVYSGGGDAGTNISWEQVQPVSPGQPLDYGNWAEQPNMFSPVAPSGIGADGLNALYREILGRDADPSGISTYSGMSADRARQALLDSAEYKARLAQQGGSTGGGTTPFVPVNPSAPAGGGGIGRNPAAVLNTSATQSPVFQPAQPYYQTTNDVQSQYAWAPRSAAQPLAQNIPTWGQQQPTQAFNVEQFVAEMLGPKAQAQTATLPTPFPGR